MTQENKNECVHEWEKIGFHYRENKELRDKIIAKWEKWYWETTPHDHDDIKRMLKGIADDLEKLK